MFKFTGSFLLMMFAISTAFAQEADFRGEFSDESSIDFAQPDADENDSSTFAAPLSCRRANSVQIAEVNRGFAKLGKFLAACAQTTNGSRWCNEVVRPNPASSSIFHCTYGTSQPHNLIHPDESTWNNAFKAIAIVEQLENAGIKACTIYNWWRPEPYNKNVGGAPGRHPFGTSIDVRFCSMQDMERAHTRLCQLRKQGYVRAVGYYGTTALHFGIGDRSGNTWGKSCP